jgi:hypothetical protein
VVFYELLTGRKPFQAETPLEMFQQHVSGTFERPSRLVLDIPIWLDTLVCQLLEKSPDHRPRDAAAVGEALGRIVEKVQAQQSAGVEAVKARVVDRPRGTARPDEEDREAARELRAALGKKRGKRRGRPFYAQIWFQALGILGVLFLLVGGIYLGTRPPPADSLYRQAEKLMTSGNFDDRAQARSATGPIPRYLRHYGDQDTDMTRQVRAWADQVDAEQRERTLYNRLRLNLTADGEAESTARRAVELEQTGDLAGATERWQALQKYRADYSAEQRSWGLLAEKRLRELDQAARREQQLLNQIDLEGNFVPGFTPTDGPEKMAAEALRFEVLKKTAEARDLWVEMKTKYDQQGPERIWALLAARKTRELAEAK